MFFVILFIILLTLRRSIKECNLLIMSTYRAAHSFSKRKVTEFSNLFYSSIARVIYLQVMKPRKNIRSGEMKINITSIMTVLLF